MLAALNSPTASNIPGRGNITKLIDLFLAREISLLPLAKGIVVNVVTPGLCVSDIRREWLWPLQWLVNKIVRSTEEGSKNIVWAALEETSPGGYVAGCRELPASEWSRSEEGLAVQRDLWEEMVAEWIKAAPEMERTVKA